MKQKVVKIGNIEIGNQLPFSLLCGPCQIESKQHSIDICGEMLEITKELGIPYIFKASFDKANRSSISGARGVGFDKGMETFDEIKNKPYLDASDTLNVLLNSLILSFGYLSFL